MRLAPWRDRSHPIKLASASPPLPITTTSPKGFPDGAAGGQHRSPAGRSKYRFVLVSDTPLTPNPNLSVTRIPDSTPGLIEKYAFNDEQALLARVRYNRLVDIFLGIVCWSQQNHLRTTVTEIGQVETDEMYVGDEDITITAEKHYQLVSHDKIPDSDLVKYRQRLLGNGR